MSSMRPSGSHSVAQPNPAGPRPTTSDLPSRSTATISSAPQCENHRRSSCQRGDSTKASRRAAASCLAWPSSAPLPAGSGVFAVNIRHDSCADPRKRRPLRCNSPRPIENADDALPAAPNAQTIRSVRDAGPFDPTESTLAALVRRWARRRRPNGELRWRPSSEVAIAASRRTGAAAGRRDAWSRSWRAGCSSGSSASASLAPGHATTGVSTTSAPAPARYRVRGDHRHRPVPLVGRRHGDRHRERLAAAGRGERPRHHVRHPQSGRRRRHRRHRHRVRPRRHPVWARSRTAMPTLRRTATATFSRGDSRTRSATATTCPRPSPSTANCSPGNRTTASRSWRSVRTRTWPGSWPHPPGARW